MKKTTTLLICFLMVTGILIYEIFMYKNLKKKHARYLYQIENSAYYASADLLRRYKYNIYVLNKYCRSDTIKAITKNDFQRSMAMELGHPSRGWQYFYLLTNLYYNDKNGDELDAIREEYNDQFNKLWEFYLFHHGSDHYDFSVITKEGVDSLITYNKKLASSVERLQKIKIGP
jgi:hypothetical protein